MNSTETVIDDYNPVKHGHGDGIDAFPPILDNGFTGV